MEVTKTISNSREAVIQFGEGGLLRGFMDYSFHKLQEEGLYDGKAVVVQPVGKGMCQMLADRNCEYNLFPRGTNNGQAANEHTHVISISRALNPYTQYEEYTRLMENPDLRVIVSNTTETGIEYLGTKKLTDTPPKSYPAKLTQSLYKRFQLGLKGFILLPCKLTDNNADNLKKCIPQYVDLWELGSDFKNWLENENNFCNTLVDRIAVGYPRDEMEELTKQISYIDNLVNTAEIFHLWITEGHHEDRLPFNKVGYNIMWTDDARPYRKRKVRTLNGGHTSMVLGVRLYGLSTVGEYLKDETVNAFLKRCIFKEIVPILGDTRTDVKFDEAVLERFSSPFIKHQLLSTALNSVSKFQICVLPTILEYKKKFDKYPAALTLPTAALTVFYRTDEANDRVDIMEFMRATSTENITEGENHRHNDLTEMIPLVIEYYNMTQEKDMAEAYRAVLAQAAP